MRLTGKALNGGADVSGIRYCPRLLLPLCFIACGCGVEAAECDISGVKVIRAGEQVRRTPCGASEFQFKTDQHLPLLGAESGLPEVRIRRISIVFRKKAATSARRKVHWPFISGMVRMQMRHGAGQVYRRLENRRNFSFDIGISQ